MHKAIICIIAPLLASSAIASSTLNCSATTGYNPITTSTGTAEKISITPTSSSQYKVTVGDSNYTLDDKGTAQTISTPISYKFSSFANNDDANKSGTVTSGASISLNKYTQNVESVVETKTANGGIDAKKVTTPTTFHVVTIRINNIGTNNKQYIRQTYNCT